MGYRTGWWPIAVTGLYYATEPVADQPEASAIATALEECAGQVQHGMESAFVRDSRVAELESLL